MRIPFLPPAVLAALLPLAAAAAEPIHAKDGLAVSGYDAVAYFTEGRARRGSPEFEHAWSGVTWRFSSAAHRDAFAAEPARYAPQYGGYCAWAVSKDYTYAADPEAWAVVGGKLYLNYDRAVQERWRADADAIARADRNWPAVLEKE